MCSFPEDDAAPARFLARAPYRVPWLSVVVNLSSFSCRWPVYLDCSSAVAKKVSNEGLVSRQRSRDVCGQVRSLLFDVAEVRVLPHIKKLGIQRDAASRPSNGVLEDNVQLQSLAP